MRFHYTGDNAFETEFEYGKLTVSGDEEKGYRPFQLMVSSIAVCSASVLRKVLEKQKVEVEDIEVEADVTRDPDKANRISRIELHYKLKGSGLKESRVEKAVRLAAKNCPMAQTVADSVDLTETFEIL